MEWFTGMFRDDDARSKHEARDGNNGLNSFYSAVVQKYLLEKSRIVSQGRNERNYHVFYYLLAGASEQEKQLLHLESCDRYNYLNKSGCYGLENIDERHEFSRLKQSMEMVGFTPEKQRRLFAVLSAVLLLGKYRIAILYASLK